VPKKITRIHVNQHAIRRNVKMCSYEPVITVKQGRKNTYGYEVLIHDNSGNVIARVVQPQDKKLDCGARVWVETTYPVTISKTKTTINSELEA
jgi:hypothetical protein